MICKRHRTNRTFHGSCLSCDAEIDRLKNQRRKILAAWRAINAWVKVETMPDLHPLQKLRKALGK